MFSQFARCLPIKQLYLSLAILLSHIYLHPLPLRSAVCCLRALSNPECGVSRKVNFQMVPFLFGNERGGIEVMVLADGCREG